MRQSGSYYGANGMKYIFCGQIEARCYLGLACGLLMALFFHHLMAITPQLDTAEGMDAVVNAGMAGLPAALHLAVGSVDNGINFQGGNIAPPNDKANPMVWARSAASVIPRSLISSTDIHPEFQNSSSAGMAGRTFIRAKQPPLALFVCRYLLTCVARPLQQLFNQVEPSFVLGHVISCPFLLCAKSFIVKVSITFLASKGIGVALSLSSSGTIGKPPCPGHCSYSQLTRNK